MGGDDFSLLELPGVVSDWSAQRGGVTVTGPFRRRCQEEIVRRSQSPVCAQTAGGRPLPVETESMNQTITLL